jgi:DNA-directed RNA polymerase subunit M/transcription elongation factor TFIIS
MIKKCPKCGTLMSLNKATNNWFCTKCFENIPKYRPNQPTGYKKRGCGGCGKKR